MSLYVSHPIAIIVVPQGEPIYSERATTVQTISEITLDTIPASGYSYYIGTESIRQAGGG